MSRFILPLSAFLMFMVLVIDCGFIGAIFVMLFTTAVVLTVLYFQVPPENKEDKKDK